MNRPLHQDESAKLAKELAKREDDLKERENTIKVLERVLPIKQSQLASIKEELQEYETKLDMVKLSIRKSNSAQGDELNFFRLQRSDLEEQLEDIRKQTRDQKAVLESLKQEAAERHRYLKEQEELISNTVEDGNSTLRGITYEIKALETQKTEAEAALFPINQEKNKLTDDILRLHDSITRLAKEYELDKQEYDYEISKLKASVVGQENILKQTTAEVERKLAILKTKEESIVAKLSAIKREKEELSIDKRRFDNTKNLYDL